MSIESVIPSNHLILCHLLLLWPSVFPSIKVFSNESTLHHMVQVLELQLQHQWFQWIFRVDFFYDWLIWSPCCPRDSQESSPAPQFESISSLALSPFYGPTLTSIYDYWKNCSFDYTNLCPQSDAMTLTCSYKWQKASGSMGHRDPQKIIKDSILITSNMLDTSYLWLLDWNVNELKWNLS